MTPGTIFRVGSFDLTKFSEGELWARMNQLARFYATLSSDFRLLAYSRPYPLDEPLERIKAMMASAQDPRAREQIVAYRRFLEQIIHAAYLKDTDYYMVLFSDRKGSPESLANLLAAFLVRKVSGDTVEPEEAPAAVARGTLAIRDAEGRPILYQEK